MLPPARVQRALFSGDTLFADGYGRTDLPGGSMAELAQSLKALSRLPGEDAICRPRRKRAARKRHGGAWLMTIRLETNEPALFGELADVIRIFYPTSVKADEGDLYIRHEGGIQEDSWQDRFYVLCFEHTFLSPRRAVGELAIKRERKRAAKTGLGSCCSGRSRAKAPPGDCALPRASAPRGCSMNALEAGDTPAAAALYLREKFFVSEEKAGLLKEIERMQRGLRTVPPGQFDLYIGIPFCPTRCASAPFPPASWETASWWSPISPRLRRKFAPAAR